MSTASALPMRLRLACAALGALVLSACGGGGGGGGPGGPAETVTFLGFTFVVAGVETAVPPLEDLTATPPSVGAPLNTQVVFTFSGVPEGPFNGTTLPVRTTAADVTPEANAAPGAVILAKGTYERIGNTVVFTPFVPTAPLKVDLASPPEAVPGLLPASGYSATVSTTPGQSLANLIGGGGTVDFSTTSNPAAYFPAGQGDFEPPAVLATTPAAGATGFSPNPFDDTPYDAPVPTFPAGAETISVTYSAPLKPELGNIDGSDLDGDGAVDPTFFLRSRASRLIVGGEVPASSSIGNGSAFAALSALEPGEAVAADGSDIIVQDGATLPDPDDDLEGRPVATSFGTDQHTLFAIFEGGRFGLVDHLTGDASGATTAAPVSIPLVEVLEGGTIFPFAGDFTALTQTLAGRLIAYERTSRRLFEFDPDFTRTLPSGDPVLTSVTIRSDIEGNSELFRSEPMPVGFEILDIAQEPDGELFALANLSPGAPAPTIVRLAKIDPDLDDVFDAQDGVFLDQMGDVVLALTDQYSAIEFARNGVVWALNRTLDSIDEIDLETGVTTQVVTGVGAYGTSLAAQPDGLSPATTLAVAFAANDVDAELLANGDGATVVQIAPRGLLPIDAEVTLMQRVALQTLVGVSLANASAEELLTPLGAVEILDFTTAAPTETGDLVHDVFLEDFLDETFEANANDELTPSAVWAAPALDGSASGALRASIGIESDEAALGDFLPVPASNFNPEQAFKLLQSSNPNFRFVFLDTDVQSFPLPSGATPGITQPTTIEGGVFNFRDFIIPEGVWVRVTGTNPLRITATGRVEIAGVLDIAGVDGLGDDTFNTGFIPVPGGAGGPGAGRGGNGHPTRFDPNGPGTLNQYVTPETGERGFGPVIDALGNVTMQQVGGHGGLSTTGYDPKNPDNPNANNHLFPRLNDGENNEFNRPPGGGGGSFFFHGTQAPDGSGDYLVQSESTWFPFTLCPTDNGIDDVLYGNEENLAQGILPNNPLQCVYRTYRPLQPGGMFGDTLFDDDDPTNNFIGPGGEVPFLIGGQGGGSGGSRIDSVAMNIWSSHPTDPHEGLPLPPGTPGTPPFFPKLFVGVFQAPTFFDAKSGGAGGGGGSVLIRSLGDIVLTETGHIDASGGEGNGGEVVQNATLSSGGGGGSGGAVILQAAGEIIIKGDASHLTPYWDDSDGARGAAINVSGGAGFDARTQTDTTFSKRPAQKEISRSDGGQGGFGLIQLQEGSSDGIPTIEQGAFLYAGVRPWFKLGPWITDYTEPPGQATVQPRRDHPDFNTNNPPPDELRYVDMLHYRGFRYDTKPVSGTAQASPFILLNGSFPPIIEEDAGGVLEDHQLDTKMFFYEPLGKYVVQELQPEYIFQSYAGFIPEQDYTEIDIGPDGEPGIRYGEGAVIPLSIKLNEPDGTPIMVEIDGQMSFDPLQVVDRLPVVNPALAPAPFGASSRGISKWLDFSGAVLRDRDGDGVSPPFFAGVAGTYNALVSGFDPADESLVIATSNVPGEPARYVTNTPGNPFDPGLVVDGVNTGLPFNDIAVNAPELSIQNAITNNASVSLQFQGAFPVRVGSSVPDAATRSEWVADLRELNGYPLVRFRVTFDLGIDPQQFPFGLDSFRPSVDFVRVRADY